ncbi:MAG: tyrosine--tRNA ligase [Bacillota bacterium]
MGNVYDVWHERGLIQQITHEEPLRQLLATEVVTAYVGYDATADSLHVGHLVTIMALAHLQRAGHRPIAVVGGGTSMVGDPSGKTEMRPMLTPEEIEANKRVIRSQLGRFLDFGEGRAMMVDNAEWLLRLNYVEFLREVGPHLSVNRMLTAEAYRSRWERGLTFLEFNYMPMQAYDFLTLNRRFGCRLQMGGDDQWSNILAGVDLVRRLERQEAYGLTTPLLATASGKKMGKTEAGAVWLSAEKTSPFEFYQFWRNIEDADVGRFLAIFTFLPMDEVRRLGGLRDRKINQAKEILAHEVTRLVHGAEEADRARSAAQALFGGQGDAGAVPSTELPHQELSAGVTVLELMVRTGLAASKSEARRTIQQGGLYLNGERVDDMQLEVTADHARDGIIELRKGKKGYHHVRVC